MPIMISGQVVPLAKIPGVSTSESSCFAGKVWIADDGVITAITKPGQADPQGFANARSLDLGTALIFPGLIDLHSHLAYAPLPLWQEPGRTEPFKHHDSWPGSPSYAPRITWPAYAYITACPEEALAYAEIRALIGGTTSIQGSPPRNRPLDGWLLRNVEDETLGKTIKSTKILASTLKLNNETLGRRATQMRNASTFIYHCAEGQVGSIVESEYQALKLTGCLQHNLVAIHTNALEGPEYGQWSAAPGTVVWSPFSNLWLYGSTTDVPAAIARGIAVCVGSDWGPSGTRNVLGELKVAQIVAKKREWNLSPLDLVKMVTANPGDVLTRAWGKPLGRLRPEALADLMVVESGDAADPFQSLIDATEKSVSLVMIGGKSIYGRAAHMRALGAQRISKLTAAGADRVLSMHRLDSPTTAWSMADVLARMEKVRANPKKEIDAARVTAFAAIARGDPPGLRLALDMPTGKVPVGGLPKDLSTIVVPPIQPLVHDKPFFDSIHGGGFHGGLLDELAAYYG
ncbi:MAG: amidohydrolase family protein [Burkholderiaceae bacterium]